MNKQDKSILDGMEVKENPQYKEFFNRENLSKPHKSIVSRCPTCGSPIYGYTALMEGEKPEVIYSCDCKKCLDDYRQKK